MPEGDTVFRTAATLRRALAGRPLVRFDAPRHLGPVPVPGQVVTDVEARGKHLLVHFAPGGGEAALTLRTHLRMTGTWHLYRPGERWRKAPGLARVTVEVPDAVAVGFAVPVVEVLATADVDRHRELARLGPDLSRSDADLADAAARMGRLDPATDVGTALLDQRVACGVGNVYRCEVLHACGLDPTTPLAALDAADRLRLPVLTRRCF